jgi:hypothetical protein
MAQGSPIRRPLPFRHAAHSRGDRSPALSAHLAASRAASGFGWSLGSPCRPTTKPASNPGYRHGILSFNLGIGNNSDDRCRSRLALADAHEQDTCLPRSSHWWCSLCRYGVSGDRLAALRHSDFCRYRHKRVLPAGVLDRRHSLARQSRLRSPLTVFCSEDSFDQLRTDSLECSRSVGTEQSSDAILFTV